MQTHKLVTAAVTALGLMATAARAELRLELGINKRHVQTSPTNVVFDSGELRLLVRDGNIILAFCVSDPELYFYPPHLLCPEGITGYIASGDFDRDGVRDDGLYYSIDTIVPAFTLEPSRPDRCFLASAPPSKLPRPLKIFADQAVTAFFDIRSPTNFRQYDLSRYEMVRRYGPVRQVETAIAAGSINENGNIEVVVTSADINGGAPLTIQVPVEVEEDETGPIPVFAEVWASNVRNALAANPAVNSVYSVGGTGTSVILTEIVPNGNDPTLNIAFQAGTVTSTAFPIPESFNTTLGSLVSSPAASLRLMDQETIPGRYVFAFPRLNDPDGVPVYMPVTIVPNMEAFALAAKYRKGFRITSGTWDGSYYQMDPRIINTVTWLGNDRSVVVPGDKIFFSVRTPSEDRLLFPPTVPQAPVRLPSPAQQSYTLPPAFFDVGQEGVINLNFNRELPINGVSYDRSIRDFRARVRFVDSYPGYRQAAFPLGNTGDTEPYGDFDGDGMTNIEEYAFQFPTNEELSAVARRTFTSRFGANTGLIEEFRRVVTRFPEPIASASLKPSLIYDTANPTDPGATPYLDENNYIVYRLPYRPLTGNTLRYDFYQSTTNAKGKVKMTKLATTGARAAWTTEIVEAPAAQLFSLQLEVSILDAASRDVLQVSNRTGELTPVSLTRKFIELRSKNPVKNPAAPLPNLGVKIVPIALK